MGACGESDLAKVDAARRDILKVVGGAEGAGAAGPPSPGCDTATTAKSDPSTAR